MRLPNHPSCQNAMQPSKMVQAALGPTTVRSRSQAGHEPRNWYLHTWASPAPSWHGRSRRCPTRSPPHTRRHIHLDTTSETLVTKMDWFMAIAAHGYCFTSKPASRATLSGTGAEGRPVSCSYTTSHREAFGCCRENWVD